MAADAHLIRAIRGPVTLITLGLLFTLDHFTRYNFTQTWPVLLIVFGLLSLMRRSAMPPVPPPPPGIPAWAHPPAPPIDRAYTGGYRQSSYGNVPRPDAANTGTGNPPTPPGGAQ